VQGEGGERREGERDGEGEERTDGRTDASSVEGERVKGEEGQRMRR